MQLPDSQNLDGLRVVLLRTPGRSVDFGEELARRGALPFCLPLIDFERPADPAPLERALERLAAGGYDWLVVTSATTVTALEACTRRTGSTLAGAVPAGTRAAAVGEATAAALSRAGVPVSLTARNSSAQGLLAELPPGPGALLLPQASLADDALDVGLSGRAWRVDRIEAYRTVDYPADPALRLSEAETPPPSAPEVLDAAAYRQLAAEGVHAVVLTSPSTARRFSALLDGAPPNGLAAVAIGPSTAAEAARVGLRLAATADAPTPRGVADAVAGAVAPPPPSPTNGVTP
ncbi:uroporphyrinogen-III synthase [Arthrobacter sp. MSA 4-2]|uniref:uroporphyrinogen-III synthase n=1 Tax=Arthrobacter sp. MSA 4-2 TaxID=2794349 RepID=UPI0018E6E20C|nr:uroporphyrinogen-III synthase [Arthrobacter sp. MSA 4-2]MBJ2121040.1 uroporphyrinogen-III synthase [Arthrobacter sp. MSA 4-2]